MYPDRNDSITTRLTSIERRLELHQMKLQAIVEHLERLQQQATQADKRQRATDRDVSLLFLETDSKKRNT